MRLRVGTKNIRANGLALGVFLSAISFCHPVQADGLFPFINAVNTSIEQVSLSAVGDSGKKSGGSCAYRPASPPPANACPQILDTFSKEDNDDSMSFLGLFPGENVKANCHIVRPKGINNAEDAERLLAGVRPAASLPMLGTASFRGNLYSTCLKNFP